MEPVEGWLQKLQEAGSDSEACNDVCNLPTGNLSCCSLKQVKLRKLQLQLSSCKHAVQAEAQTVLPMTSGRTTPLHL